MVPDQVIGDNIMVTDLQAMIAAHIAANGVKKCKDGKALNAITGSNWRAKLNRNFAKGKIGNRAR